MAQAILLERARKLRRDMTEAEKKLWSVLKNRNFVGYKFRRQHPAGPYILDFACTERALVIEVDGGQHCENVRDTIRTAFLENEGWQVIRFWNNEVLGNIEGVKDVILRTLANGQGPHPPGVPPVDLSRGTGEVN